MKYKTMHPVALKSQKWLLEALLELMQEKNFQHITIKDLTVKAQVDRSTFYRNFAKKEDILDQQINLLADEYINILNRHENLTMDKVAEEFFSFCNRHLNIFVLLRHNNLSGYLLEAFNRKLIIINEVTENQFSYQLPSKHLKYALAFNAGGMWNILNQWIDNDMQEPYTELIHAFKEIARFNTAKYDQDK